MKKYEFTGETKMVFGVTLRRIRALVPFGIVAKGELGGWIEKESNLADDGNAWVYGNARVYGNAQVFGDAQVSGNARVFGNAQVYGNAWVFGNAWVSGDAQVYGNAWVFGNARVYGNAQVSGNARVYGNAWVSGDAQVYGNAWVFGNARVYGNAQVSGNARVYGNAWVSGDAHYLTIGPIGSRNDTITFTRDRQGSIFGKIGCFFGGIANFREKVAETHGDNVHAKAYLAAADLAEIRIDTTPIEDVDNEGV